LATKRPTRARGLGADDPGASTARRENVAARLRLANVGDGSVNFVVVDGKSSDIYVAFNRQYWEEMGGPLFVQVEVHPVTAP
jgi:hypothetical protein